MKRVKDPWRKVRSDFKRYFFDGQPWTYVEGKNVFMAHSTYVAVVVQHLGKRVHRVLTFSDRGRTVVVVPSPVKVYDSVLIALGQ